MHWEILIIPLIALGVWILGTLFKGEEGNRTKGSARRPGGSSGRPPARRPVTDLDRFLEEARRRREAEERQQTPPAPPQPVISRPPLRERPAKPRETPPQVAPPVMRTESGPVAVPVARPVAERVAEAAPSVAQNRTSPSVQQVRALLSKPQTAGTAFVLREIFDRPRCKRKR